MKDKLRDHIYRNLVRKGAPEDVPVFPEILDRLTEAAKEEYDRILSGGGTDLEAYRGAVEKVTPELDRSVAFLKGIGGEGDAGPSEDADNEKKGPEQAAVSTLESATHSVLWLVTVGAYFAVSFIFGHWNITWIMFLSAAAGSVVINMVFALNRGRTIVDEWDNLNGIVWLTVIAAYFLISFLTGKWAFTWLIFIAAIAISVILDAVKKTMLRSHGGSSEDGGEDSGD